MPKKAKEPMDGMLWEVLGPEVDKMREVLELLGIDLEDENFRETHIRFVRYLKEYLQPYDVTDVLGIDFANQNAVGGHDSYKGLVAQTNIPWNTICPHHLLPVIGRCHIGYIPNDRVVGLSKLTRLAQAVGREKPRMQETCTDIIADQFSELVKPKGIVVVISAIHGCMSGRGVLAHETPTVTSTVRGVFRDVPQARAEFFELVRMNHVIP